MALWRGPPVKLDAGPYDPWAPRTVRIEGAKAHPTPLVQSVAMAAVYQRPREEGERIENGPQQLRIVFSGMTGFVPTALIALSLDDTELLCDRLNSRLGLNRKAWSALVVRSMAAGYNGARAH